MPATAATATTFVPFWYQGGNLRKSDASFGGIRVRADGLLQFEIVWRGTGSGNMIDGMTPVTRPIPPAQTLPPQTTQPKDLNLSATSRPAQQAAAVVMRVNCGGPTIGKWLQDKPFVQHMGRTVVRRVSWRHLDRSVGHRKVLASQRRARAGAWKLEYQLPVNAADAWHTVTLYFARLCKGKKKADCSAGVGVARSVRVAILVGDGTAAETDVVETPAQAASRHTFAWTSQPFVANTTNGVRVQILRDATGSTPSLNGLELVRLNHSPQQP
eukprot:m.57625 g.57625  ORF g.57625 m.57625 type:complete len:271 (-) comp12769_c1_seq2:233-1045(-)